MDFLPFIRIVKSSNLCNEEKVPNILRDVLGMLIKCCNHASCNLTLAFTSSFDNKSGENIYPQLHKLCSNSESHKFKC
ncbi:CLUMA_CG021093, isoform A [Clunio marinus]|uniref:CLUMA_CG021093, isoform A n=1 Tax=Clunio marinus TaxID=568069 RepID=A0A1J1J7F2_9DIPT|nr:CLUMA_CG021093, isoform A [Clunio marinus]